LSRAEYNTALCGDACPMKKKPVKDISASVQARLLNLARSTRRDFQELTIRYTVERFPARLAENEHRDRFILKGACCI
jgi:hypothetical protein